MAHFAHLSGLVCHAFNLFIYSAVHYVRIGHLSNLSNSKQKGGIYVWGSCYLLLTVPLDVLADSAWTGSWGHWESFSVVY